MKKGLLQKKLELFKEHFPEYKVSASGSLYTTLRLNVIKKPLIINGAAVTKGTLNNLWEKRELKKDLSDRLLITNKGKLLFQMSGGKWRPAGIGNLQKELTPYVEKIADIFFFGRKAEYLRHHKKLWRLKYFYSFTSLREAKVYIGYGFISDKDFLSLFEHRARNIDIMGQLCTAKVHEERVSMIRILQDGQGSSMQDYIKMCLDANYPIQVPTGKQNLRELHDTVTWEMNKGKANNYSDTEVSYESELFDYWDSVGLKYKVLSSPRELFLEGVKQHHCLGSYGNRLSSNIFVAFEHEGNKYDLQMSANGVPIQFKGFKNCGAPKELEQVVVQQIPKEIDRAVHISTYQQYEPIAEELPF